MAKVKFDSHLYDRAKKAAQAAGYSSVDEFVIHLVEKELDRLETKAIELMDDVGRRNRQAGQVKVERDTQEDRGSEELARMDDESKRARAAEQEIVSEIDRLIGLLPDRIARHVIRLRTQYPQAVVRVQEGACGGCFSLFPAQQGIDAEQGKALIQCPSCARFVVHRSWK